MGKSYGFIEITGVVAAVDALDIMLKAADVRLATWERKLGGRLVTIVVEGEVAAVKAAVEAAFPDIPIKMFEPNEAVAKGAAMHADGLAKGVVILQRWIHDITGNDMEQFKKLAELEELKQKLKKEKLQRKQKILHWQMRFVVSF